MKEPSNVNAHGEIRLRPGEAALVFANNPENPDQALVRIIINDPMIPGTEIPPAAHMAILGVAMHHPRCSPIVEQLIWLVKEHNLETEVIQHMIDQSLGAVKAQEH